MPAGLSVRSRFQKFLSVCVALLLGVSLVSVLGQGMARAAVVCPTVAPTVPHTVTPAPQSGDNWSGCDLTDAYLQGVDLSGVNFTGANLTGVSMWFATITGADFTNVNFPRDNRMCIAREVTQSLVSVTCAAPSSHRRHLSMDAPVPQQSVAVLITIIHT